MSYKNILVSIVANLGDVIFSTATAPLIKNYYPEAKITFLVRASLAPVLYNHPYIDDVIPFDYKSSGDYLATIRLAKVLKKQKFDLSFSLCNRLRSDLAIWLAGVEKRVGPGTLWNEKKSSNLFFTNNTPLSFSKETSQYINLQKIIKYFANDLASNNYQHPIIGIPQADLLEKACHLTKKDPQKINLALCVKAEHADKNWDVEKFSQTISLLGEKYPLNAYIVGMPSDIDYAEEIISRSSSPIKNLCGKTSLVDLSAVLASSNLLLSIDNGTAHLASALNIPVVCIYTNTSPLTAPPLSKNSACVNIDRLTEYENLKENEKVIITVDEVASATERVIDSLSI